MSTGISHFRTGKKLMDGRKKAHIIECSAGYFHMLAHLILTVFSRETLPPPFYRRGTEVHSKVKTLAQAIHRLSGRMQILFLVFLILKSVLFPYYFAFLKEIIQIIQRSAKTQRDELIFSVSQSKSTADGIRMQTS